MKDKRNVDLHNLKYHPKRVIEWLEKGDCPPIYIEIGPTNNCNHKCVFCALDWVEKETFSINKEIMLNNLEYMATYGVKSIMFAGEGEPLLHKNINEFIRKAKESGLAVSVTSNGIMFNKQKAEKCLPYLSWIRFSVDAGSNENYAKIHGTKVEDFDKIVENVKTASRIKKELELDTNISSQFLMVPGNINETLEFVNIFKAAGADNVQIKPYSRHPYSKNELIANLEDYSHLEKELKVFNSQKFEVFFRKQTIRRLEEGFNYNQCYGSSFFALVDSKGNVMPCGLFYDNPKFTYGNLNEQNFREIWQGEKRKKVLQRLKEKGVEGCRNGCRLDACNRYLSDLKKLPKEKAIEKVERFHVPKEIPDYLNFI